MRIGIAIHALAYNSIAVPITLDSMLSITKVGCQVALATGKYHGSSCCDDVRRAHIDWLLGHKTQNQLPLVSVLHPAEHFDWRSEGLSP